MPQPAHIPRCRLVDVAFVPAFVLVLCSGWRTTTLLARMRKKKGVAKRKAVLKQLGALLVEGGHLLGATYKAKYAHLGGTPAIDQSEKAR